MPEKRRINPWLLVFLALLWLGATFAYFGDIGKHSDDYWATLRSIEGTGLDWKNTPWKAWNYFWRPLHLFHIWFINTVFWKMDWVPHLELAAVHGLVCWLFYVLLVRLGSARAPALCAAVLFGTCPLLGEAICWSSASCNAIGAALMLWALLLVRRMASKDSGSIGLAIAVALVSFAAACFSEPAAAGLVAAPIVAWAAAPPTGRAKGRLARAFRACAAAGTPCVLYAALLVRTAPKGNRGSADTLVRLGDLSAVAGHFMHEVKVLLWGARGRDIVLGSIEQGFGVVVHRTTVTFIVLATVIAGAIALGGLIRRMRTEGSPDAATGGRGALPLIGLAMFVFSLVPFIASGAKGVELRSVYVPLIGVGFVIAGAANALRRASGALEPANRRTLAAVGVGLVGATAIAGQLGLIGFQTQFRNNFRLDKRVTAQLATFAPAVQKQTVFMILATDHRGAKTSRDLYNAAIHTALEAPWSANVFLRRAMKRRDVHVIAAPYWSPEDLPITISPSEAVRNTGEHIGWERVVPLWIDGSATVHIGDTLRVRPPEGKPYTIAFPRADSLDQNAGHAAVVFELVPIGPAQTRVDRRTAD